MERMPFQPEIDTTVHVPALPGAAVAAADWRRGLPTLCGSLVVLRELRMSDAEALLAAMSTEDVARFISPPPTTTEGFEKFIAWAHRERPALTSGRGNAALKKLGGHSGRRAAAVAAPQRRIPRPGVVDDRRRRVAAHAGGRRAADCSLSTIDRGCTSASSTSSFRPN
jgi:hypothetical protein